MNFPAAIKEQVDSGITDVERINFDDLRRIAGLLIEGKSISEQWEFIVEADKWDELPLNLAATLQDDLDGLDLGNITMNNAVRYAKPFIQEEIDKEVRRRKEPTSRATPEEWDEHIIADNQDRVRAVVGGGL